MSEHNQWFHSAKVKVTHCHNVIRQPDVVGTALSFTAVLFSFFFFLATHYSQQSLWRRVRPSNLYARFGPSWSFKPQLRDLAYPSPNFYRGRSKSAKFGIVFNIARLCAAAFQNAARYLKSETNSKLGHDRSLSFTSLVQFGPRTPEIYSGPMPRSKIWRRKCAKSWITRRLPRIVRFRSYFT